MLHSPSGAAQRKTDTVKRAMEILKDRPMSQPNAADDPLRNMGFKKARTNKAR
jgi:hypothetical protein